MKFSKIKKEALKCLSGNWKNAIIVTLSYFCILFLIEFSILIFSTNYTINVLLSTLNFIISIPLSYGLTICFIKLKQRQMVHGFNFVSEGYHNFAKSWSLVSNILLKLVIPILLFILIYILMYLSRIVYFSALIPPNWIIVYKIFNIFLVVSLLAVIIWALIKYLSYALVFNIAYTNNYMSDDEVLAHSKLLMQNNKKRFLLFQLSFIGWGIISLLLYGIGLLWLIPYMKVSTHCFYEYLVKNK